MTVGTGAANTTLGSPTDSGAADADDDGGGVDCTFPNDPSICGCGNACVGNPDRTDYGLCQPCGSAGSGCVSEDIWCCSDSDCPGTMLCTTIDADADLGYHICVESSDLDPCTSVDDCYPGERCQAGRCRDG
jgi:hypothetical protein